MIQTQCEEKLQTYSWGERAAEGLTCETEESGRGKDKRKTGRKWGERREITLVCSIKSVTDLSQQFLYKKKRTTHLFIYCFKWITVIQCQNRASHKR